MTFEVLMVVSMKMAVFMVAACTSETLVNFYQTTWCNDPEDSHLQNDISKKGGTWENSVQWVIVPYRKNRGLYF
jgi:hypothetical protein